MIGHMIGLVPCAAWNGWLKRDRDGRANEARSVNDQQWLSSCLIALMATDASSRIGRRVVSQRAGRIVSVTFAPQSSRPASVVP